MFEESGDVQKPAEVHGRDHVPCDPRFRGWPLPDPSGVRLILSASSLWSSLYVPILRVTPDPWSRLPWSFHPWSSRPWANVPCWLVIPDTDHSTGDRIRTYRTMAPGFVRYVLQICKHFGD